MLEFPSLDVMSDISNAIAMGGQAYPCSIRARTAVLVVMPHFVKIIFVQLPYKACKVAVLKVLWEYVFCEFFIL